MSYPDKTTIVARINKTGTHVVCGRPTESGYCGCRLAAAVVNQGGGRVMGKATLRPPRHADGMTTFDRSLGVQNPVTDWCHVVFGPGWQIDQDDGVWRLSNRAKKRRDSDRQIAASDAPTLSVRERDRARQRLASGRSMSWTHGSAADAASGVRHPHHPEHRADLPTFALCPDCTGVNRLDERLRDEAIARFKAESESSRHNG